MPQGDGTGPLGKGPGVGRNPGLCRRDPERQGRGRGRGLGRKQRSGQDPRPGEQRGHGQTKTDQQ